MSKDPFNPKMTGWAGSVNRLELGTDWQSDVEPVDEDAGSVREPIVSRQLALFYLALFVVMTVFVVKLLQLQINIGSQYRSLAEGNSLRAERLPATRGLFFDHNGNILARNTKRSALQIKLENLPASLTDRENFYADLKKIVSLTDDQIKEVESIRKKLGGNYSVSTELTKEQLLLLKELAHRNSAVVIEEEPVRQYEMVPALGGLLGYVGQVSKEDVDNGYSSVDLIGKSGLENTYENRLRGVFGIQEVAVDAHGRVVQDVASDQNRPPKNGDSLRLSIDNELQKQVADLVTNAMNLRNQQFPDTKDLGATVILMEPATGLIRSLVSLPSYDNNLFANGITKEQYAALVNDPTKPLFNRATSGQYPPGSTIKPIVATGALQNKIVSPNYSIDTPAAIEVGGATFPDWKDHGVTDIRTAIAESNNIFFYMLGGGWQNVKGLGFDRLVETMRNFGLESKTGIDTGSESSGFILSSDWKQKQKKEPIYLGDVYHLSIGQGDLLVTPLQMATATAAIANGGSLITPRLGESWVDSDNQLIADIPTLVKRRLPYDIQNIQIVKEGMRKAVVAGSSRPLNALKEPVSGKTGTAQFGNNQRTHAWFTGFAPFDNPEIVVTVLIEGGGGSFEAAIPLAEQVLRAYFHEPAPVTAPTTPAPTTEQNNSTNAVPATPQ